jgi:hypothetical protein
MAKRIYSNIGLLSGGNGMVYTIYLLVLAQMAINNETRYNVGMDRTWCDADFDLVPKPHQADHPEAVRLYRESVYE